MTVHATSKTEAESPEQQAFESGLTAVRRELAKWSRGDVLGRHRIGELVQDLLKRMDHYGEQIVPRLARELDYSPSWLYECMAVAEAWKRQQIEALVKQRDEVRGQPLRWSHLVLLASLADGRERRRWVDHVLQEGLTVQELKQQLAWPEGQPETKTISSETSAAWPWLRDIQAGAEAMLNKQRQWRQTFIKQLESGLELDEPTREQAEQTLAKAREAKDGYEKLIDELEKAVQGHAATA